MAPLLQSIRHHPGFRGLYSLTTLVGRLLPRDIPYVNESLNFAWRTHRKAYNTHRTSILSDVSLTGNGAFFFCSTPSAVRALNADRRVFRKPVEVYKILKYFGSNVLVTEGDEWRRHRKVSRRAVPRGPIPFAHVSCLLSRLPPVSNF